MSQQSIKVLAVGSANGKIREYFNKISTINSKHGPFDMLLCVGDLFAANQDDEIISDLVNGKIEVPLASYFITGQNGIPDVVREKLDSYGEVCPNLFYMGNHQLLTTTEKARIAALSGMYSEHIYENDSAGSTVFKDKETTSEINENNCYRSSEIESLIANITSSTFSPPGIDILITYEWPRGITTGSKQCTLDAGIGSLPVAKLAAAAQPRYHFAASENIFFEREPYTNSGIPGTSSPIAGHVTRFIALGEFGNPNKQRWYYAFYLVPLASASAPSLLQRPQNTTESPLSISLAADGRGLKRGHIGSNDNENGSFFFDSSEPQKKKGRAEKVPPEGYICKICGIQGHFIHDCPKKAENYVCHICKQPGHLIKDCPQAGQKKKPVPPENYVCNICKEPGHFIKDCPQKGSHPIHEAISPEQCWFCLANPNLAKHLIVNIGEEIYLTLAKGPLIDSAGDAHVPGGGHALIVPISHTPGFQQIPSESRVEMVAEIEKYKSALRNLYEAHGCAMVIYEVCRGTKGMHAHLQAVPIPKEKAGNVEEAFRSEGAKAGMQFSNSLPPTVDSGYLKIDLPDNTSLVYKINPQERFNLQFPRVVLAQILGKPERSDWRACSQTVDEERQAVQAFRKNFDSFFNK
ncbi:uncharacterized protein VTP21DRAFT_5889 [Calcarisporiella thermophila]|uniref:uncharacterized protein n=1 Tax=Calcarisporiella thermophila TaxID=911321 RepID=UPI003742D3F7